MRFEERDLKPYAQPVTAKVLEQEKVYFSVQFADDDMLIPVMETWVFAGSNLDPEDAENHLYFQDVESYLQGIRYGTATEENATFQVALEENTVMGSVYGDGKSATPPPTTTEHSDFDFDQGQPARVALRREG
jgi:hypothetical protein